MFAAISVQSIVDKVNNGDGTEFMSFIEFMWKHKSVIELAVVLNKWRIESTANNKNISFRLRKGQRQIASTKH